MSRQLKGDAIRIVIEAENGIVTQVWCNAKGAEVTVIDLDVDNDDELAEAVDTRAEAEATLWKVWP